jgi:hypothetical protein
MVAEVTCDADLVTMLLYQQRQEEQALAKEKAGGGWRRVPGGAGLEPGGTFRRLKASATTLTRWGEAHHLA